MITVTDLFSGDIRLSKIPLRKKFQANFNNKMGAYLRSGFTYASFFWKEGSRMMLLTKSAALGGTTVCAKGPNSGCFTKDSNDLFEEMEFVDQNTYALDELLNVGGAVIFRIDEVPTNAGFIVPGLLLTISAPEQSNRHNVLALASASKATAPAVGYTSYRTACDLETDRTERASADKFLLQENRFIVDVSRDHIFSCYDGFVNGIPPEIIAHYTNLQYLSKPDNSSKGRASWKTLEALLDDYQDATGIRYSALQKMINDYRRTL